MTKYAFKFEFHNSLCLCPVNSNERCMIHDETVIQIAQKIRAVRLQKKLTIQQLADRAKLTKGLISKIENSRTVPSLPVFVGLIRALDVSLKDFFEDITLNVKEVEAQLNGEHLSSL